MHMSVTFSAVIRDLPNRRQNVLDSIIRVRLFMVQPGQGSPAKIFRFIKLNTSSITKGTIVRHSSKTILGAVHSVTSWNFFLLKLLI